VRMTVLGSCGGFPVAGRACSGYLVEAADHRVWVDAGAGTLHELLRHCDPWDLDAIWISHLHADHWTDLPIALHRMALTAPERFDAVPVFGPPGWSDGTGVTAQWRLEDDDPVIDAHELSDGDTHTVGALTLEAVEMDHSVTTFGLRVSDGETTLGYSADTTTCDAVDRVAAGTAAFLCESAAEPGVDSPLHLNPGQAARHAAAAGAERLILTHLWPTADPEEHRRAAAALFDGPVEIAEQGRVHEIDLPEPWDR
jgi:ribonuclease BN (tRNA processing enzyme)